MDLEERKALIARNVEEMVTAEELDALLRGDAQPRGYIGFEPSGKVHLGWLICAQKIRDLSDAGVEMTVLWADWHAYINDKLGGDIDNIRICAAYMQDCFEALGVPPEEVRYLYASEVLEGMDYWEKVSKVAKVSSLSRVRRAMTIMGRSEDEAELDASKTLYPILQATDIFSMGVDIAYAGMDQRRAHMLARDAADKLGWRKPIAIHTPLLPGLKGGNRMDPAAGKMSKSDPNSGISIHDTEAEIKAKMRKAYCPTEAEEADNNPVLLICQLLVFDRLGKLEVNRPEKFGGPLSIGSMDELLEVYLSGSLHPSDLKNAVAEALVEILAPVREYFEKKSENLEKMDEVLQKLGRA